MAGLQQIGAAFVRLFTRRDELSAGLKAAESEVASSAAKMQQSAEQAARGAADALGDETKSGGVFASIKAINKAFTATIGAVLKFAGHIGLLVGLFAGLVAGAVKLHEWLTRSERSAAELGARIKTIMTEIEVMNDPESHRYDAIMDRALTASAEAAAALQEAQEKTHGRAAQKIIDNARMAQEALGALVEHIAQERADAANRREGERTRKEIENAKRVSDALEEGERRHEAAVLGTLEIMHRIRREQHEEWSKQIEEQKQKQINAAREVAEIRFRYEQEAFQRIESLRSASRNQGVSADIRVLIGLVKQLVDN